MPMTGKKIAWTILAVAACLLVGLFLSLRAHRLRLISDAQSIPIEGAVIERAVDAQNQLPIAGVAIAATDGISSASTQSDAAGYFKLVLKKRVLSDRPVMVTFR